MRRDCGALLAVVACVAAAMVQCPAVGDETSLDGKAIQSWVAQLANDNYTVRQTAADRLLECGFAARDALLEVADGPDPEVRAAARRLITLIDQSEFSRRLAEFAADVDGKSGTTLPGWEKFRELVGDDEASRTLFVEMQRQEAPLFSEVFGSERMGDVDGGGNSGISWEERIMRLQNWQTMSRQRKTPAPLGSCATMFFLGALEKSQMSDTASVFLARLTQRPPMNEALQPKHGQPAVRKLVSAWLVHCPSRNEDVIVERVNVMLAYQLTDALPLARGAARGDEKYPLVNANRRIAVLQAIGRLGSEEDALALEPLLVDRSEFVRNATTKSGKRVVSSVQVRDVALAMMLHLTGQDVKDYGFMHARRHPQTVFDPRSLGMKNDERRDAAAAQWRDWRAANLPDGSASR